MKRALLSANVKLNSAIVKYVIGQGKHTSVAQEDVNIHIATQGKAIISECCKNLSRELLHGVMQKIN